MSLKTVDTLFDKVLGLSNEHQAAIFVTNITNGYNITEYSAQFYVDNAKDLLDQLRYHVQDFLLQGVTTTKTAKQWIEDGYTANFMDLIGEGDF